MMRGRTGTTAGTSDCSAGCWAGTGISSAAGSGSVASDSLAGLGRAAGGSSSAGSANGTMGLSGSMSRGPSSSTSSWAGWSHPAMPHPAADAGSGGSSATARSGSVRSSDTSRLPFLATPRHCALTRSDRPMVPDEGRGISEARRRRTPHPRRHESARRGGSPSALVRERGEEAAQGREEAAGAFRSGWCTCGCSWAGSSGPAGSARRCSLFEGWDASGKGGAIKRLAALLDPRHARVRPILLAGLRFDRRRLPELRNLLDRAMFELQSRTGRC